MAVEEKSVVLSEMVRLKDLVSGSDSIELKLTVPEEAQRSTLRSLELDPLEAQIRQVFFFDTPDLTLNGAGVVARARRIQGRDHDSVVKLRPVEPDALPDELRQSPNVSVEVDVTPDSFVCSASLKTLLAPDVILPSVRGEQRLRKIFSKEQRRFFEDHTPDVAIDDLTVLGPIFVLKLKVKPVTFPRKVTVEMWLYPDGSRILELSTKCLPGEGLQVVGEVREYLDSKGISVGGMQQTKTKTALEFFSSELQAAAIA